MRPEVVQQHHRDDGPVQVDELQRKPRISSNRFRASDVQRHIAPAVQQAGSKANQLLERRDGIAYPVVGQEVPDEPEEYVDVEEEEDVGEEERVRGAPRGHRAAAVAALGADEGQVEEDGRERDEEGDDHVLEVAAAAAVAGHGDRAASVSVAGGVCVLTSERSGDGVPGCVPRTLIL